MSETSHGCVTPAAYRTDFRASKDPLPSSSGHKLTLASLGRPDQSVSSGNLSVNFAERSEVYVVNPGHRTDEGFSGFKTKEVVDTETANLANFPGKPRMKLAGQAVSTDVFEDDQDRWRAVDEEQPSHFWLSSQKITNSLQIGPLRVNLRLRIEGLDGGLPGPTSRDPIRTSVRAAAISATEIIMHRAALKLDIAPEEFDALAPYAKPEGGSSSRPRR